MFKVRSFLLEIGFAAFCLFGAMSLSGCRLILEPESDAVARILSHFPTGDYRHAREMCDGEEVCKKLNALGSLISSDWYNARSGFFEITSIERAEDTGYSYVHVDLSIPASGGQKATKLPLIFEMERVKFRWHIYSVDGIDEFLRRASRARGIL